MQKQKNSAAVQRLISDCKEQKEFITGPVKVNSYMTILDYNKFLQMQLNIIDAYEEKTRAAQGAITRLSLFRNYIKQKTK